MNTHYLEEITFELEKHLIPPDKWDKDLISKFPENLRDEIEYNIRWSNGEEKDMPHPIGLGFREDIGYFMIGCGQGPFIIWSEKEI